MLSRLRELSQPPPATDAEQARRAALLQIFLAGLAGWLLLITAGRIARATISSADLLSVAPSAAGMVASAVLLILVRRGQTRLVTVLTVLGIFAVTTFESMRFGMIRTPLAVLYLFDIMLASLLLDRRWAATLTALSGMSALGLFFAQYNGLIEPAPGPPNFEDWLTSVAAFAAASFLIYRNQVSLTNEIEQARRNEKAMFQNTRDLQAMRTALEKKIAAVETAAEHRWTWLEQVHAIARDVHTFEDVEKLYPGVLRLMRHKLNIDSAALFRLDSEGKELVLRATTAENGEVVTGQRLRIAVSDAGRLSRAIATGAPQWDGGPETMSTPQMDEIHAEARDIVLPLIGLDNPIGVMRLTVQTSFEMTTREIKALQILADQIARALENLSRATSPELAAPSLGDEHELAGAETLRSYANPTMQPRAYRFRGHQIEALPAPTTPPQPGQQSSASESESLAARFIPIRIRNRVVGQVRVQFEDPRPAGASAALLQEAVDRLALALENAHLLEQVRLRSDQLQLLQEITAIGASHVELDRMLSAMTEKLVEGVGVSGAAVILSDPEFRFGTFAAVATTGAPSSLGRAAGDRIVLGRVRVMDGLLDEPESGILYNVTGRPDYQELQQILPTANVATAVLIPLISRNEMIGVVILSTEDRDRRLTAQDLSLLEQISRQMAAAIEVARLFEQTMRRAERKRLVTEITNKIRSTNDPQTIIETAVQELRSALNAGRAEIHLEPTSALGRGRSSRKKNGNN